MLDVDELGDVLAPALPDETVEADDRQRRTGPELKRSASNRTLQQRARRTAKALDKSKKTAQLVKKETVENKKRTYEALNGVLVLRDSQQIAPSGVPGGGLSITFQTMMRAASGSVYSSSAAFASAAFGDTVHHATVTRARTRVSSAIALHHWRNARSVSTKSVRNCMTARMDEIGVIDALSPDEAPTMLVLGWKFDSTPHNAALRHQASPASGGADAELAELDMRAAGSDCFVQRGCISVGDVTYPIVIPPAPLPSSSAKAMMKALRFKNLVSSAVVEASQFQMVCSGIHSLPLFVIMLLLTTDQAGSNTKLIRYLSTALSIPGRSAAANSFLILVASSLCLAHQLSLCCCTTYAFIGGNWKSGEVFVAGLLGFAHIFKNAHYLVRIWRSAIQIIRGLTIMTTESAATLGIFPDSAATLSQTISLVGFLLSVAKKRYKLTKVHLEAVRNVCCILNVRGKFAHVCDGCEFCRNGLASMTVTLIDAFRILIFYQPPVPSLTRWTSVSPACAYAALWMIFCMLAVQAVRGAYKGAESLPLVLELTDGVGLRDYSILFGFRLGRTYRTKVVCLRLLCVQQSHTVLNNVCPNCFVTNYISKFVLGSSKCPLMLHGIFGALRVSSFCSCCVSRSLYLSLSSCLSCVVRFPLRIH